MALEQIIIDGKQVATLKELLRPGLRAVIVGVNPGLRSVSLGHYWQGPHGKLMWNLFSRYGILSNLRPGHEDEDAFDQGIGLADLIRLPSRSAKSFKHQELQAAIPDLLRRLSVAGRVPMILRYRHVDKTVGNSLRQAGYTTLLVPSPPGQYSDSPEEAHALMEAMRRSLGTIVPSPTALEPQRH